MYAGKVLGADKWINESTATNLYSTFTSIAINVQGVLSKPIFNANKLVPSVGVKIASFVVK